MAATINALLDGMLRNTTASQVIGHLELYENTEVSMLELLDFAAAGADWGNPAAGEIALSVPKTTTFNATGTIAKAQLRTGTGGGGGSVASGMLAGLTGGEDVVVDRAVITGTQTTNVTQLRIQVQPNNGTVKVNEALRNRLLKMLTAKATAGFAASGTVDVYSGSAPSSVEDPPTGTKLISFATTTTSWNAASGGSSALASSISATGIATDTAAYARFTWTSGGETYVIQGSIGTASTDFIISSVSIVSGNSFNLTAATLAFP